MKIFTKKALAVILCSVILLGIIPLPTVTAATIGRIDIIGPSKITDYNADALNSYTYSTIVYDTSGNVLSEQSAVLSLTDAPNGVSISGNTLTVGENTKFPEEKIFKITAAAGGITASKNLVALDYETYKRDEARLNVAIEYINKALEMGADKEGTLTPLLADSVNVKTGEQGKWQNADTDKTPLDNMTLSNLTSQGDLMRAMDILSDLTGVSTYKDKVNEIYQYYLGNYTYKYVKSDASDSEENVNRMFYWGGHMAIDLAKDSKSNTKPDNNTHEFKNHMPYMKPFFTLDESAAASAVKSTWISHITDFSNLLFNRHAKFGQTISSFNSWTDTEAYNTPDPNVKGPDALIKTTSVIPFKSTANDLIYTACKLYEETGDTNAIIWAKRLADRYVAVRDPETNLGGIQFTTADTPEARQKLADLENRIGKKWYEEADANGKLTELGVTYTYADYGDRAQNQFADEMIEAGYFTEDEAEKIQEAYVLWGGLSTIYGTGALVDIMLAEAFEKNNDTETKNEILKNSAVSMAAYADYAYIPETNKFKALWANGTDMTGYVAKRSGYYGSKGTVFKATDATSDFLLSYSKMYLATENISGLDAERAKIWNLAKEIAKANNLGTFGDTPNDTDGLNLNTDAKDPLIVYTLVNLYADTGKAAYLDLARKVADNMVDYYYNDGYLVDPTYKYARLSNTYIYALVALEAASKNDFDLINDMTLSHAFYSSNYIDENGVFTEKAYDNVVLWPQKAAPDGLYDIDNEPVNYDRTYENKTISGTAGWNANADRNATVTRTPEMADANGVSFEAADKAVMMVTTNGPGIITKDILDKNKNSITVTGNSQISARLYGKGANLTVDLCNSSGDAVATMMLKSGDNYTPYQWFTLSFSIDSENKKYTVKTDDNIVTENEAIQTESADISEIKFTTGGTFYADDIIVVSDAKPTPRIDMPFSLISTEKLSRVTKDLNLVSAYTDSSGTVYDVVWESSNENILSGTGKVYRDNTDDKNVVLNAHLTDVNGKKALQSFPITVTRYGRVGVKENFDLAVTENQEITAFDSTWTLYSTNTPVTMSSTIVKAPEDADELFTEADKVLMLNRTAIDNAANHRPKKEFDTSLSGKVVIKTRLYVADTSRYAIKLRDANKKDIVEVYFDENGTMSNALSKGTQSGTHMSDILKTSEWTDIMLFADTNAKQYDVYINGEKINSKPWDFYYYDDSTTYNAEGYGDAISYIEFDIKRQRSSGTLYIDDIEAREVSNKIYDAGNLVYNSGSVVAGESFDSKTLGNAIAKSGTVWTLYNKDVNPTSTDALTSTIAADPDDPSNKVLKLQRTSTSGTNHRVKMQFDKPLKSNLIVDFKMRAEEMTKFTISLKNDFYPVASTLTINNLGDVSNTGGGSKGKVFSTKQWMDVSLHVDVSDKQYDLYVNGTKINTTSYPFSNSEAEQIEYIEFDIDRYTESGLFYIDNIEIRELDGSQTITSLKNVAKIRNFNKASRIFVAVYDANEQLYDCKIVELPADMAIENYKIYPIGINIPASLSNYEIKTFIWENSALSPVPYFKP